MDFTKVQEPFNPIRSFGYLGNIHRARGSLTYNKLEYGNPIKRKKTGKRTGVVVP